MRVRAGVVVAVVAVLVLGCSKEESSTGPGTTANYFPLAVGNWWVYQRTELDTAGNPTGPQWRDSTVVVGQTTAGGRQAYVMVTYRGDGEMDTSLVASEGGTRLYLWVGGEMEDLPGPTGWVKIADFGASSWRIWDTTLTNVPVDTEGTTVSGNFTWQGSRGGTRALTIKGRSVTAQEFLVTLSFQGDVYSRGVRAGTLRFRQVQHFWIADGIGVVASRVDPSELVIQLVIGGSMTQKGTGEDQVLVDYYVK
jgi:hypothetical protein